MTVETNAKGFQLDQRMDVRGRAAAKVIVANFTAPIAPFGALSHPRSLIAPYLHPDFRGSFSRDSNASAFSSTIPLNEAPV